MSVNMLNIRYVNHLGEELPPGVYAKHCDLLNYKWSYNTRYNRICNLKRNQTSNSIPLLFICPHGEDPIKLKNKIMEVFEKDIIAEQKGKLYIGEYYKECFVTGSEKSNYGYDKTFCEINITIETDAPQWTKEDKQEYFVNEKLKSNVVGVAKVGFAVIKETIGIDFPFDYPFDYEYENLASDFISNDNYMNCDFIMVINGFAEDPVITIGDNVYKLNYTIEKGEYVVINSKNKTIMSYGANGETNIFSCRDKENYIFEKIEPGNNNVAWNGVFTFSVTLLYERSSPEWI